MTPEIDLESLNTAHHTLDVDAGDTAVYVLPDVRYAHVALSVTPEAGATYDAELTLAAPLADTSMMTGWTLLDEGDVQTEGRAWTLSPAVTAVRVTATAEAVSVRLAFRT